jgi:hypothetical protein
MPLLSADHFQNILQVIVDRILALEPMLHILDRQTQFSKKKLTWTREERERAEAEALKAASGQSNHSLTKENQTTLEAFLDALFGVLKNNPRTQNLFESMDIVLMTLPEAEQKELERINADRASASDAAVHAPPAPAKEQDASAKSRSIGGGYDLMVRLLQSPVTRRYAIRQLESLLEFELKLGPRYQPTSQPQTPSVGSPHLGLHSSKSSARTRHASMSLSSPSQSPMGSMASPGGLGIAPSMYNRPLDRRNSSLPSSPMPLGTPGGASSPAAQFAAITRGRSSTSSLSPGHQHSLSASSSSSGSSSANPTHHISRHHGVNHYIQLLLDLLHELPANDFETRTLYLRSLRHVCTSSPYAQHFFRQRSGFFNLYLLIDKLKVPELQRRRQLRKVTTKVGGRALGSMEEPNELDQMRNKEDERLANVMLFVRQLFFTLTAAYKQNANSRLLWSRFGYDRMMDVIYESEMLHFPNALQLIVNWLLYMALEHIPIDDRDCSPLLPRLNPPHALDAEYTEFSNASLLYMPLAICPALSLLPKTPLAYQVKMIEYLSTLARNDVANRAGLGKCLLASTLVSSAFGPPIVAKDVKPGDKLVGEDGAIAVVKSVCALVSDDLYTITSESGSYTVTGNHRLTLRWNRSTRSTSEKLKLGQLFEITPAELVKNWTTWRMDADQQYASGRRVPLPTRLEIPTSALSSEIGQQHFMLKAIGDGQLMSIDAGQPVDIVYQLHSPLVGASDEHHPTRNAPGSQTIHTFLQLDEVHRALKVDAAHSNIVVTELKPVAHAGASGLTLQSRDGAYNEACFDNIKAVLKLGATRIVAFGRKTQQQWMQYAKDANAPTALKRVRIDVGRHSQMSVKVLHLQYEGQQVNVYFSPHPSNWHETAKITAAVALAHRFHADVVRAAATKQLDNSFAIDRIYSVVKVSGLSRPTAVCAREWCVDSQFWHSRCTPALLSRYLSQHARGA